MPQIGVSSAFQTVAQAIVVQTTDATPIVVLSHSVGTHKVVGVELYVVCFEHTMSAGAVAWVEGLFHRVAGDLIRTVAPRIDLVVTAFGAPQPQVTFVANIGTQSIDVQITGKATTTLRWHLDLLVSETA
mgnify:CR=1 FL=1